MTAKESQPRPAGVRKPTPPPPLRQAVERTCLDKELELIEYLEIGPLKFIIVAEQDRTRARPRRFALARVRSA